MFTDYEVTLQLLDMSGSDTAFKATHVTFPCNIFLILLFHSSFLTDCCCSNVSPGTGSESFQALNYVVLDTVAKEPVQEREGRVGM